MSNKTTSNLEYIYFFKKSQQTKILMKPEEQALVSNCGKKNNQCRDIFLQLKQIMTSFYCYDDFDINVTLLITNFYLCKDVNGDVVNVQTGPEKSNRATSKIMMGNVENLCLFQNSVQNIKIPNFPLYQGQCKFQELKSCITYKFSNPACK